MLILFANLIEKIIASDDLMPKKLKRLRDLLANSLLLDDFRLACVDQILHSMENWRDPTITWNEPPLFCHEQLNITVRCIFWPAFYAVSPHQHNTWSVTGILHNALSIHTYELLNNPPRLKKERTITAAHGDVGFLMPGCIHNISNHTHELAASLHIFNTFHSNKPEESVTWYGAPRTFNLRNGLTERALLTCLHIVSHIQSNQSLDRINRIYDLLPISSKLIAVQAMYRFDRMHARKYFFRLERHL